MRSSDQVSRLLALVPYLQRHPDADLRHTADLFHVTPRQLIADLQVLWYCGLPGGLPGDLIEVDMDAVETEGRIRLTNADYLDRPLRFSLDEAMSLAVALRALLEMGDSELTAAVRSALTKIEAAVGDVGPQVGVQVEGGTEEIREHLAAALDAQVAVQLTYHGASRGVTTTPVVEPVRVVVRDGYAYLDAWSRDRNDWRTYRLDRIAEVAVTNEPVAERGEAPTFDSGWLDQRPDATPVTLDVTSEARWITEYFPMQQVEERPDGGARVTMLVADPAWLRRLLLRLGTTVVSVDPPEAARSAEQAARDALALYDETAG